MTDQGKQAVSQFNGTDFMDRKDVPHGAVERAFYCSSAWGEGRRMQVYTPPGYETGKDRYPALYLLHGVGGTDDSWTSIGRANFILDNLIANKWAQPMIVVMPMGHTGQFNWIMPTERPIDDGPGGNAGFEEDFFKNIKPYVESHYRVRTDRSSRAIAGFSMGGDQTLNIFGSRPKDFAYVGVFSSGVIRNSRHWEKGHKDILSDAEARESVKLLWFATGIEDFMLSRTQESVALFKRIGFSPVFKESDGGHTWNNWQKYLNEFSTQIFR